MDETIDNEKVFLAVLQIKRNLEIETIPDLERIGLERICIDNGIDWDEFTEVEKEELWKELIAIMERIEFEKDFRDFS